MEAFVILLGSFAGMIAYGFVERSRGADRRAQRQRRARERLRVERMVQREIERTMPQAVALVRDQEQA